MSKTLLFLRHAKSDWDAPFDHDHERPLNKRGRKAAKVIGRFMKETGITPDFVLASTAVRAQDTLRRVQKHAGWDPPGHDTEALYLAEPGTVLRQLQQVPEPAETVLVVSHEPTCSGTIEALTGGGAVRFPTAALARVDLEADRWTEAAFGTGTLVWLVTPRLLTG